MKVLENHTFTRKSVGSRVHDWNTLLDGQARELEGTDLGNAKPATFISQARTQAKKRGKVVHAQTTEAGGVILQAVEVDSNGEAAETVTETAAEAPAQKPVAGGAGRKGKK